MISRKLLGSHLIYAVRSTCSVRTTVLTRYTVQNTPFDSHTYKVTKLCRNMSTDNQLTGNLTEDTIRKKLKDEFQPTYMDVINESYMHNVPKGSETHFKVVVVSDKFDKQSLVNRHRLVNTLLQQELAQGVHALSIMAKTPAQWEASEKIISESPKCLGGSKS